MVIRNFFGGLFLMAGCAAAVLIVTAMLISMQLDTGHELLVALGGLAGAALCLLFGVFVLLYRR